MSDKIKWNLPLAIPGGDLLPHVSANYRRAIFDGVFEDLGGAEGFSAWAKATPENRTEFYKMWAKGQAKASTLEVTASEGIESIIKRLDERDKAREANIIDSTAVTVVD